MAGRDASASQHDCRAGIVPAILLGVHVFDLLDRLALARRWLRRDWGDEVSS